MIGGIEGVLLGKKTSGIYQELGGERALNGFPKVRPSLLS
jgi:hypothetical protein